MGGLLRIPGSHTPFINLAEYRSIRLKCGKKVKPWVGIFSLGGYFFLNVKINLMTNVKVKTKIKMRLNQHKYGQKNDWVGIF